MTDVIGGEHISPRCIRIDFDGPMRNNADLTNAANYTVGAGSPTVLGVYVPTAQQAPYDIGDPNPNGGKPFNVYLVLDSDPYLVANPILVTVDNAGAGDPVDYYAAALLGIDHTNVITLPTYPVTFWEDDGVRVRQAFDEELPKLGKPKFGPSQPVNRSMALAIAKLADMVSGGSLGVLGGAIDGPLDTADSLESEGYFVGGFGEPEPVEPGVGDTLTFADGRIPFHIDKVWGNCDGINTLFRTSISYHSFCCMVLLVPPEKYDNLGGEIALTSWFSPDSGKRRLLRLTTAPMLGWSVIAIYIPRQSLLRIGKEIIAYHESVLATGTAIICGRSQLCSTLESHAIGDILQDVWCESFIGRASYNLLTFGASGKALEYTAQDMGLSRSDNPSVCDTELRRMVFNTAVTPRATFPTALLAFRYIYPDLWKYCIVGEDPRWPKCLVVWYHNEQINFDTDVAPGVEPWETWLDHLAYSDGFPTDTLYATYFRDPIGDVTYDGDYYTDPADSDVEWPYPIVISGPDIYLIGTPADYLPEPYWVNGVYKKFMRRSYGLDRVLPVGCGVLLLDFLWAT